MLFLYGVCQKGAKLTACIIFTGLPQDCEDNDEDDEEESDGDDDVQRRGVKKVTVEDNSNCSFMLSFYWRVVQSLCRQCNWKWYLTGSSSHGSRHWEFQ